MSEHSAEKDALRAVRAIHDRTHWCFDADEQSEVFERGVVWPCPTLAALDATCPIPPVEGRDS